MKRKNCRWSHGEIDSKKLLYLIQSYPSLLLDEKIACYFIEILDNAKWNRDSKKAKEASDLLKDYLIPLRPGGKKRGRYALRDIR
jgi:hypothetical protein